MLGCRLVHKTLQDFVNRDVKVPQVAREETLFSIQKYQQAFTLLAGTSSPSQAMNISFSITCNSKLNYMRYIRIVNSTRRHIGSKHDACLGLSETIACVGPVALALSGVDFKDATSKTSVEQIRIVSNLTRGGKENQYFVIFFLHETHHQLDNSTYNPFCRKNDVRLVDASVGVGCRIFLVHAVNGYRVGFGALLGHG